MRVVRAAMGIHLVLGLLSTIVIWCMAGVLADRLALHDTGLRNACVWCSRIAAILTSIRSIETVCIRTQKAYERYGAAVSVSVVGRLLSLAAAGLLALRAFGIAQIMAATAVLTALALAVQLIGLQRLLRTRNIAPRYEGPISTDLLQFGAFTWILAATGVVFSQADRLIGGASLGAAAVVSYALCAQLSQPIYGLTAAGLHFLFPYIACRRASVGKTALTRTLWLAVLANVLMVLTGTGLILVLSGKLLRLIATEQLARACAPLLPYVLAGSALLALSVTGSYAMVALGRVRTVAFLNLLACMAIIVFMAISLRGFGVMAIADGRIAFALIALCVYIPLSKEIRWRTPMVGQLASAEAVEGA